MKTNKREAWSKRRVVRCNANIAAQRKTKTGARTWSVYGGHYGLGQSAEGTRDLLAFSENCAKAALVMVLTQMFQMIDIAAGAECTAFAGNNKSSNAFIRCDGREDVQDFIANRTTERIEFLRPVELKQTDRIMLLKDDGFHE